MFTSIAGLVTFLIALLGAIFTYYKFFREGSHHQRVEFDIELIDLGTNKNSRIIEIGIVAKNKGNIEQKFDDIRLKIRGMKNNQELSEIKNHEPRLSFPEKKPNISIIPKKYQYFFVRPNVSQRFPVVLKIPSNWGQLHTRATFKYFRSDEIHSSERAFKL